ncbi:MAG: tetratricopeptide repeat protein [Pyrinomonadaceae bacterium]
MLALMIFSSILAFGQDLGNIGGSKTKPKTTPATTTKKTTPTKTKTATVIKKTTPKTTPKTTTTAKTTKKTTKKEIVTKNKPQVVAKQNTQSQAQNTVVITPAKTTNDVYDERFEDAIDEGNAARDDRNYVKAENAYRRAQTIRAEDSRAVYGLGNIYSDQQRWEEAEKSYREAIRIEPGSPYAYIALSFVLVQPISGSDLLERYEEAERMARRAIQLDPQNTYAHDQLGVALELRGVITQETENAYRRAIQIDADSALAYAHLGRLLRRKGMINESTTAYSKAITLSTDVPTMILVAEVMQSQQRYTDSEQLLRRALRDDPKNPTALFLLGRALTTRASFDEAESVLKKSVLVSPTSFVSYSLLGSLYLRKGNYAESEKTLFKALQVASPSEKKRLAQEFENVGDALMKIGKRSDAVRIYKQAVQLDGEKTTLAEKLAGAQRSE